jgi:nitric oxide reductase large subunit
MKEKTQKAIVLIGTLMLSALGCTLLYDSLLFQTFNVPLSYWQWIAINIICNFLFKPIVTPQITKNDSEGTKIPRNIFKNGF